MYSRLRRSVVPATVLLLAPLAACQEEAPAAEPAYVGAAGTPRLELTWFTDDPDATSGLTVGEQPYVDPCSVLPPDEAGDVFGLSDDASLSQQFLTESADLDGSGLWFFCAHRESSDLAVVVWTAHHGSAEAARSSVRGPDSRRVKGTDLWHTTLEVGGGPNGGRRLVVSKAYGALQVDVDIVLARGGQAAALRRAQQAFQRVDETAGDFGSLSQAPLPPTLGDAEAVGDAVILPACELLSSRIVEHVTDGQTPHASKTQTVLPADLTHPDRQDGVDRAHRGGCFWSASSDPGQAEEDAEEVHLQIGYAPDAGEAAEELDALLRARGVDRDELRPLEGVGGADDGGYVLTDDGISMWAFRVGSYAGALSVSSLDGSSQEFDPERGLEPLDAILERLDRLVAERAAE